MTSIDEHYMKRALELARRAEGATSPNPAVGAVIVQGQQIAGEGFHRRAGAPHAEIEALAEAGSGAGGATLYVTLEPCNHHGKTPPCSEAIIEAGIKRVVYAVPDPNRKVAGGGADRLKAADIDVVGGVLEREARYLNRFFFHHAETGRPWIIAKFAASLDGKIATSAGESKWITGEAARTRAHELRALVDAILVGAGTVVADDPELTVRMVDSRKSMVGGRASEVDAPQPVRVVLDSRGRTATSSKVYDPDLADTTIVICAGDADREWSDELEQLGVEVVSVPADAEGRVDLPEMLDELGGRGIQSLMVEGGSEVLGSFLAEGLIDEVWAFLAPTLIGGNGAASAIGGQGVAHLSDRFELADLEIEQTGSDILIRGIRSGWNSSQESEVRLGTEIVETSTS